MPWDLGLRLPLPQAQAQLALHSHGGEELGAGLQVGWAQVCSTLGAQGQCSVPPLRKGLEWLVSMAGTSGASTPWRGYPGS